MFWIAWPDAPLTRLSMADNITILPVDNQAPKVDIVVDTKDEEEGGPKEKKIFKDLLEMLTSL